MWLLRAKRWEAKILVIKLQERTVSRSEEHSINTPIYLVCSVTYLYRTLVQLEWFLIRSVSKLQIYDSRHIYRGADKSLARPGRKQARKHVRDGRDFNNIETRDVIKFFFSLCQARRRRKFTPF